MGNFDKIELGKVFRGELIAEGDENYDSLRRVWNGSIDRRPALIARCTGPADVIAAVDHARARDLLVAVRGGSHSIPGFSTCDNGIVIDLSRMKGVRVDPVARRAVAQAGLVWGDLDHETQAFGLAVPGGIISTTGISGFTLGGGMGWLSRKYGLACDRLVSADVVTANGQLLRAGATENADLFWGLRGGGGNFGIVTSFEYELCEVSSEVMSGVVYYPASRAREVLQCCREFLKTAPDEVLLVIFLRIAPPSAYLPEHMHRTPIIAIGACYAGAIEDAERTLKPLRQIGTPLLDLIQPRRYVQFQNMFDANQAAGFQNYWRAEYLKDLPDAAIEVMIEYLGSITSPLSEFKLSTLGGQITRIANSDAAYSYRDAPLILLINARWTDPKEVERHSAWVRDFWSAIRPFSAGGTYVNFMGSEGDSRVRAAYGEEKVARLVALKKKFDPNNLFRLNQNIRPTDRPDEISSDAAEATPSGR